MKEKLSHRRIFLVLTLLYFFSLFAGAFVLYYFGRNQLDSQLKFKLQRISDDISYQNGVWNLDAYNNDPRLLGSYPLYLITRDGFVLDRRSTIHGFLDSSDYKRLLDYQTIQTISSVTGYSRRIYSKVISSSGKDLAVITVSYFNPKEQILSQIDKELTQNAEIINSQISIKNGVVDTSKVDQRLLSYDVSFIIVDKYNTIIRKTTNVNNIGRIPNFIDPSYVKSQLSVTSSRIIKDSQAKESFLVISKPILDKNKTILGVMIVGISIENLFNLLKGFLVLYGLISLVLYLFAFFFLKKYLSDLSYANRTSGEVNKIYFDEKQGLLGIDEKQIEIPYATNQHYLLKSLFSNPSKRWESDELLDKYGELKTKEGARKVYDTMVNINRKVEGYINDKLIISQNKTFQLNPKLPIIRSLR